MDFKDICINNKTFKTDIALGLTSTYKKQVMFCSLLGYRSNIKDLKSYLKHAHGETYCSIDDYNGFKILEGYDMISKTDNNSDYEHLIFFAKDKIIEGSEPGTEAYEFYIFCKTDTEEELCDKLYQKLKQKTCVPILEEWMPYIVSEFKKGCSLSSIDDVTKNNSIYGYRLAISYQTLHTLISEGLQSGAINIKGNNKPSEMLEACTGLDSYLNLFGESLALKIKEGFKPKFTPGEDSYSTYTNNADDWAHYHGKELYEAQKSVIQAIVNNWKVNRSTLLVGEMGAGKTLISGQALYAHHANKNKGFNAIVMCPSHLVKKWQADVENDVPNAKAFIVHDLQELLDLEPRLRDPYRADNMYVILSMECAKIGYDLRPCATWSNVSAVKDKEHKGKYKSAGQSVFRCPECGKILYKVVKITEYGRKRDRKVPLTKLDFLKPYNYNQECPHCGTKLWTSLNKDEDNNWIKLGSEGWIMKQHVNPLIEEFTEKVTLTTKESKLYDKLYEQYDSLENTGEVKVHYKGRKRYPIAKYIKERMYGVFDYFIADEIHLLKGGKSHQGQAFHYLMQSAKYSIGLTGTILNGYASSIYYILYRMFPQTMVREGFRYEDETRFSRIFGVTSQTYTRANSYSRATNSRTKALPGVSPLVFTKFLMNNTVFISLEDMTEGLPSYEEIPLGIDMDPEVQEGYEQYERFVQQLSGYDNNDRKVMFTAIRGLTSYPDAPHCTRNIYNPDTDELVYAPSLLQKRTRNKEEELLNIIYEKLGNDEKILVYYNDVGTTDIGKSLVEYLTGNGIVAKELKANTKAETRQDTINRWIEKDDLEVLVCNPSLVETGLDLLDFTTIVFYQLGYNLSTMRQASRRSWRLSQTRPITVYFMYYKETIQEQIVSLMGTKLAAAESMGGKFGEEGLKAMSNNQDMLTQIAANVVDGIKNTVDDSLFTSSEYVKQTGNREREHNKPLERLTIQTDKRGRRLLSNKYIYTDKKPLINDTLAANPFKLL